nr:unnamed protein product [Digitaria exilis]
MILPAFNRSRTRSTSPGESRSSLRFIGLRPQATSSKKAPKANTSVLVVAFPVLLISGAMYPSVPMTCVVCGLLPWSYSRARPKSLSFPFMSASRSTLADLMSRCTTTCSDPSCRYSSPAATTPWYTVPKPPAPTTSRKPLVASWSSL